MEHQFYDIHAAINPHRAISVSLYSTLPLLNQLLLTSNAPESLAVCLKAVVSAGVKISHTGQTMVKSTVLQAGLPGVRARLSRQASGTVKLLVVVVSERSHNNTINEGSS